MQIAQCAGRFLDVGLQIGVVIAGVSLFLFQTFCLGKLRRVKVTQELFLKAGKQGARPLNMARFQQAGLHRDVLRGEFETLGDRAHAVADLQADVPKDADKSFEFLA